jgi:hypothetical protein
MKHKGGSMSTALWPAVTDVSAVVCALLVFVATMLDAPLPAQPAARVSHASTLQPVLAAAPALKGAARTENDVAHSHR